MGLLDGFIPNTPESSPAKTGGSSLFSDFTPKPSPSTPASKVDASSPLFADFKPTMLTLPKYNSFAPPKDSAQLNEHASMIDTHTSDLTSRAEALKNDLDLLQKTSPQELGEDVYSSRVETLNKNIAKFKEDHNVYMSNVDLYNQAAAKVKADMMLQKITKGQTISHYDPSKSTPAPQEGSSTFHTKEDLDPANINIKIPFTDKYLSAPAFFKPDPLVFGGKKTHPFTDITNFVANLPGDVVQSVSKGAFTAGMELKTLGKEETVKLEGLAKALYGSDTYRNVNADIKERIDRGDGILSSYLGAISEKTLDVAFGAQIAASGFKFLSKVLDNPSTFSEIEAWKTLGSPRTPEEATKNFQQLVRQFTNNAANPGSANPAAYDALTKARAIVDKAGIPNIMDVYSKRAGQYAEWLGRETNLGQPIFNPDLKLKGDVNAKDLGLEKLPGYKVKETEIDPNWKTSRQGGFAKNPLAGGEMEPVGFGPEEIKRNIKKVKESMGASPSPTGKVSGKAGELDEIASVIGEGSVVKTSKEIVDYVDKLDRSVETDFVKEEDRGILADTKKKILSVEQYAPKTLNIDDLIKNDPDLKEYIDANQQRYVEGQIPDGIKLNIDNPIVVGKNGEVLDGYNRILTLKNSGKSEVAGYVADENPVAASLPKQTGKDLQESVGNKNLGEADKAKELSSFDYIAENKSKVIADYIKEYGNKVNTDDARNLLPDYKPGSGDIIAYQRPAGRLANFVYDHLLDVNKDVVGRNVTLIGGGVGAGKTSALKGEDIEADVVFDTPMADLPSSEKQINKALDKGYHVTIYTVFADPVDSIARALIRDQKLLRLGSLDGIIDSHVNSRKTVVELQRIYADNPDVDFVAVDNHGAKAELMDVDKSIDYARDKVYSKEDKGRLLIEANEKLNELYKQGEISKEVYERVGKKGPKGEIQSDRKDTDQQPQQEHREGKRGKEEEKVAATPPKEPVKPSNTTFEKEGGVILLQEEANKELTAVLNKESKKTADETKDVIDVKENQAVIREKIARDQLERSFMEESVLNDPARKLSKYASRKTGLLPEVTGKGPSIFAQKGDQIITELGFKSSEEARAAYEKYLVNRTRYLKAKENISEFVTDFREKKQIIDAVTKELRRVGLTRKQKIDGIQEFFNLTDAEMREVVKGNPDYRLITDAQFEDMLKGVQGKAYDAFLRAQAMAQLEFTIFEKELRKVENLQKALKLPDIENMSRAQLEEFDELLQPFQVGDEFLGVRQLQTIKNTDLANIKTKREAIEDIAKRTGIPYEEMRKIKVSEFDRFLYDVALARKNAFYKIMVEDFSKAEANANVRLYEFKTNVNKLIAAARSSRSKGILDRLVPTDDMIFDYLSANSATKLEMAKRMTPEELTAAQYIIDRYEYARDYLVARNQLDRFRANYITNIQQGFLEALKNAMQPRNFGREGIDAGEAISKGIAWKILDPIKGIFDKYKQEAASFKIMDSDTGNVLPLEKFFRFSLARTGEITPTRNVARAVIEYMAAFERKAALDSIVPKIDIYARALTPNGKTKRGLLLDGSLKKFVNEWLNTKRGRPVTLGFPTGGKIDWAIRSGVAFTRLLDLGFSIPVGLGANVGEQLMTVTNIGFKKTALGLARSLTPQGKKIAEKYSGFVGEKILDKIRDTSKDIGDKFSETAFGLFSIASRQANIEHLLGSMTPAEFAKGELSEERLGKLRVEIGKYRTVEKSSSVLGATSVGKTFTQYRSWAVPMLHTTSGNIKAIISKIKKNENFIKTSEFQEMLRATFLTAFVGLSAYALYATYRDKKDRSMIENIAFKSMNDAFSLLGALDPATWTTVPRSLSFLQDFGKSISAVGVSLAFNDRTKEGDIKGLKKLQSTLTPAVVRQIFPSDAKSLKSEIQSTYERIKNEIEEDKEKAVASLDNLEVTYPEVYRQVVKMIKDDKAGITTEEKIIRSMGVANGERARYIFAEAKKLESGPKRQAYVQNLLDKKIISDKVYEQLKEMNAGTYKEKPVYKDNTKTSGFDIINTVATYAKAIGTDPVTAFNRIFTGQIIRRVDNGAIIVERMSLDASQQVKKDRGGNTKELKLDHKLPLELGGSNDDSNLQLVPTSDWERYSPMENYLGKNLREGKISKADAQELILQFKEGLIDEAYIYDAVEK